MVVTLGLVTSQMACASKFQKISAPLDQVDLPENYNYTIMLKSQEKIQNLRREEIDNSHPDVIIKTASNSRSLMSHDVEYVYGRSKVRNGSQALNLAIVGAGIVGPPVLLFALWAKEFGDGMCEGQPSCLDNRSIVVQNPWLTGIVAASGGALIGAGIGALIPKYNKILITPIVSPTARGVDAGVNVGVKF